MNSSGDPFVASLRPGLKKSNVAFDLDVPEGIVLDSYPGPYGQVVTAGRHVMGADEPERLGGRDTGDPDQEAEDQDQLLFLLGNFEQESGRSAEAIDVYTRALARAWSRAGHEVVVVCQEPHPERYDLGGATVESIDAEIRRIPARLTEIFTRSRTTNRPTSDIADEMARQLLAEAR